MFKIQGSMIYTVVLNNAKRSNQNGVCGSFPAMDPSAISQAPPLRPAGSVSRNKQSHKRQKENYKWNKFSIIQIFGFRSPTKKFGVGVGVGANLHFFGPEAFWPEKVVARDVTEKKVSGKTSALVVERLALDLIVQGSNPCFLS